MTHEIQSKVAIYEGPQKKLLRKKMTLQVNKDDVVIKVVTSVFGKALQRALEIGHPKIKPGMVLGTLIAGEVVNENSYFNKGTRVILNPHKQCDDCHNCKIGKNNLCTQTAKLNPGGMSEYIVVSKEKMKNIYIIPDEIMYNEAVFTEIISCVLESVGKAKIKISDRICIVGSGLTAFIHIQILKNMGVEKIYCMYKDNFRKKMIENMGGIPVNALWNFQEVKEYFCTKEVLFDGFDVLFEVVGKTEVLNKCIRLCTAGGKVIMFGGYSMDSCGGVDLNYIHYNEITLMGTYHFKKEKFQAAIELMKQRKIQMNQIMTHTLSFKDLDKAVEVLKKNDCISLVISI